MIINLIIYSLRKIMHLCKCVCMGPILSICLWSYGMSCFKLFSPYIRNSRTREVKLEGSISNSIRDNLILFLNFSRTLPLGNNSEKFPV